MSVAGATEGIFRITSLAEWGQLKGTLDARQIRLVESAVGFHSLVNPGRTLTYNVHMGADFQYPRLTDEGRYHTELTAEEPLLGSFQAQSLVESTSQAPVPALTSEGQVARDTNERHLLLTSANATDETVRAQWAQGWQVRLYDYLEEHQPIVLDIIRDFFWRRYEKDRDRYHLPRDYSKELTKLRRISRWSLPIPRIAGPVKPGAPPAVIIGMHWLQAGGAERWAVETVRIVQEAGLIPIVITDRDSHQPWIAKPEFDDALVLCLDHPMAGFPGDDPLLRSLVEVFDVRGVLVHHCQWLYDRLQWLQLSRPGLEVVDSLHVLEFGGGFPRAAAAVSEAITTHHVISEQLRDWLVSRQHIGAQKVVFAPLANLTLEESQLSQDRQSTKDTLTLAFIGRKSRQKRPEAFLVLVRDAVRSGLKVKVIMHGDGEMEGLISRSIARYGLGDVVELRSSTRPVGDTLAEADLLVITSSNEGITLTTFEALAAGVPVISTDVGAQFEVIPPAALLPRPTARLVREAIPLLRRLSEPEARVELLKQERKAVHALAQCEDAETWMKGVVAQWAK
jgi:glycosyltransferase involved in cell wall biosynthesis